MSNTQNRYLCERCGGIGQQPAGCWSQATAKYDSIAGVCETCQGEGYLGVIRWECTCPIVSGMIITGSACKVHGQTKCEWSDL